MTTHNTPEHDLIHHPKSPIMEQEVKDDYENFSELEIARMETGEYQMKYMTEKAKIEAIKEVYNQGRELQQVDNSGSLCILLNKLENIINLK